MQLLLDLEHWLIFGVLVLVFFYGITHVGGQFWD
jgi:hypothetical protein